MTAENYPTPTLALEEIVYANNAVKSAQAEHNRGATPSRGAKASLNLRFAKERLEALLWLHRDRISDLIRKEGNVPAGF